jgi:hypothetical protein
MNGLVLRPWRGLGDIPGMAAANGRLRERAGVLDPIDVASMEHRYSTLVNSDPAVDCVVLERDAVTAGYVRVEWHDLEDGDRLFDITLVVEPDAWGLGAADALLDWGRHAAARRRSRSRAIAGPGSGTGSSKAMPS